MLFADPDAIICPNCNAQHHRITIAPGETARCHRCGAALYRHPRMRLQSLLALAITALILLTIANTTPIVTLNIQGLSHATTLPGSIIALWADDRNLVAMLALATTLVFPVCETTALAAVLILCQRTPDSPWASRLLRGIQAVRPWGMVEVFMLGVLVSLVKLSHMADVIPGAALWAFAALTVVLSMILSFDLKHLWALLPTRAAPLPPGSPQLSSITCHTCSLTCVASTGETTCPRCHSPLHHRKPNSLNRTWALLIAAGLLYLPANILPIMTTQSLFGQQADTILSGIVYFWQTGSADLAALIFFVSIFIPLAKLGCLTLLLVTAHRQGIRPPTRRTRLYRLVELVGRWSMLDIFVVTLMVGMVRFRGLAEIDAGPGAAAFGAVVVLTMCAAHTFDPRLMWDDTETPHD